MLVIQNTLFVILTCLADLFPLCHTGRNRVFILHCHTEALAEVSTNSKCDFSALRHILNSVDFSLSLKMTMEIFCFLVQAQNVSFDDDKNLNA